MISILNKTALIIASICVTFALANDGPRYVAEKISIEKVKPSKGDLRRVKEKQLSKSNDVSDGFVYIIKIQTNLPTYTSSLCRIYLGDIEIKNYSPYRNGIFFKVYSKKMLATFLGKELSFSFEHSERRYPLGITAPDADQIKNERSDYEALSTTKKILADE